MTTDTVLKLTPLYDEHLALHARMVPFGGWNLPVQYNGILDEYQHTRQNVSLFDISHMGEFLIHGDPVSSGLNRIVTQSIVDMPAKSCRYGAILNEQGGVIDDLIVFRIEKEKWFIVVNGATTEKDALHFQKHLTKNSTFEDVSLQIGKLDLQGPESRNILKQFIADIDRLDYYTFDYFDLLGENVLVSRTGYTGELGYEIYYPWDKTVSLWKALLNIKEVKPAGLGARDMLRLEVGYSLYGHELDENISAVESGLKRFIDFDKDFIGKEAIIKQNEKPLKRKLIGLISESRRSPRSEQNIYNSEGKKIGMVTSGAFSPHLERGIGIALVEDADLKINSPIKFGNEKNQESAIVSGKNFYKNGSLKN
ncbi:MAG: glycine cleavage system aminomethyltransferase GcvT [Candidatus Omnitrophica bacterium]|nr:glycine cleavage system aminomethyltransferase GcvT [Candidatus Omnitrophota bacterium]